MPENADWQGFEAILQRLHQEGIYLHPHQLAYFFLTHGLPVDLCYVPAHLQAKAQRINDHYQGDMARLEVLKQPSYYIASLELGKCG